MATYKTTQPQKQYGAFVGDGPYPDDFLPINVPIPPPPNLIDWPNYNIPVPYHIQANFKFMFRVLVPTIMNGKPIRLKHHKRWDEKVKEISGGLTIFLPTKGYWVSPCGQTFNERMIPVEIMCTHDEILRIVNITLEHYNQEAVLYYRVSDLCQIVHREQPNGDDDTSAQ